jgi:hypothetical protein
MVLCIRRVITAAPKGEVKGQATPFPATRPDDPTDD